MKNSKISKIVWSLVLMAFVGTLISYTFTGAVNAQVVKAVVYVLFAAGFIKGLFKLHYSYGAVLFDGFVINDTAYAGEAASSFIVKAITSNDTVQGGHVYVKDGIKKKFTIPRWDANYEDFIQDRQAVPTTSKGTMYVTGQTLNPADYMIYTRFDPRDYEAHWYAIMLTPTLIDRTLPPTVESVVIQEVLKRHDKYLNKALWNSDSTLAAPSIYRYYDGFIKKATTASDTIVVASPTTLTVSNIQGELLKGYQVIPAALRYDPSMKFFVSYATYDLYAQSQINQQYKGVDITQEGIGKFKGREVVKIADLPDNFYFIAKGKADMESNMWVGLNSTEDAKLIMKPLQADSELWFIKMNMKVDVQIGWNSETILYNGN